jgi:hypothetical protein
VAVTSALAGAGAAASASAVTANGRRRIVREP